jgi:hypothetical protein
MGPTPICSAKAQKQLSTDRSPLELNVKHEYIPDLKKIVNYHFRRLSLLAHFDTFYLGNHIKIYVKSV